MADADTQGAASPACHTGRRLVKRWWDQLEVMLRNEAELAGLLGHGTMIGSAREFFVNRVLRSILPPSVHIGTGRVVSDEGMSKQVDVVVYDPRCPLLEIQPGVGLYFAEGVLAAIEVKSKLTPEKLREALDNCNSVHEMGCGVSSLAPLNKLAATLVREQGLSPESATDLVQWGLTPRTYIFSFTTDMSREGVTSVVSDWYDRNGQGRTAYFPSLPAVIATQGTVGLVSDAWLRLEASPEDHESLRRERGEDYRIVMGLWSLSKQFGTLAMRLLHDVNGRLQLAHPPSGATLSIQGYLPGSDAMTEDRTAGGVHFIVWERQAYQAARQAAAAVAPSPPASAPPSGGTAGQ